MPKIIAANPLNLTASLTTQKLNMLPTSTLNKSVEIYTVNDTAQQEISEKYIVEPHALMTSLNAKKAVLPLGGTEGYAVKFTFPEASVGGYITSASEIYVTFCQRNITYEDGYEDFSTLSQEYIDRLVAWLWATTHPSLSPIRGEYVYTMLLNVKGEESLSLISLPVTFYFSVDVGISIPPVVTGITAQR